MPTPITGPAYTQNTTNADVDRAVNLYPEVQEGRIAWVSTPGSTLLKDATTLNANMTPIRGIYTASDGTLYVAGGVNAIGYLYSFNGVSTWTDETSATLLNYGSSGPVTFVDNGTTLLIATPNGKSYTVPLGGGALSTTTTYTGGITGYPVFLDGFVAYCRADNNSVQVSGPYDVSTANGWNALDIRKAESSPDDLMSLATLNRQMFVFGTRSVEVWASSGSTDYPFAPVGGAPLPVGLIGQYAVASTDRAVYWLGASPNGYPAIYGSTGTEPERVSTRAIERILANATLANLQACVAWTYQDQGHVFIGFNITVATGSATSTTLVYDQTTRLWHERRNSTMATQHPGDYWAAAYGAVYCGGSGSAYVRQLSRTAATDYNTLVIQRERTAWHSLDRLGRVSWPEYELEIDALAAGGTVPFTVEVSDDGGYTWLSLGTYTAQKLSRTTNRLVVTRAGNSRDRAWRFKSTTAATSAYTILDARARVA